MIERNKGGIAREINERAIAPFCQTDALHFAAVIHEHLAKEAITDSGLTFWLAIDLVFGRHFTTCVDDDTSQPQEASKSVDGRETAVQAGIRVTTISHDSNVGIDNPTHHSASAIRFSRALSVA
jgi:hypothetical protein